MKFSRPSEFLLTHPVWDVTSRSALLGGVGNFYSHIPCGMWLRSYRAALEAQKISTHTSRVGCDEGSFCTTAYARDFYSHIPCGMWHSGDQRGGAVYKFLLTHPVWDVTTARENSCDTRKDFYSHIPCGMWPPPDSSCNFLSNFYSHIPCGMWRWRYSRLTHFETISTHTSRVGCDEKLLYDSSWYILISTHTSRVGCDLPKTILFLY